MLSDLFVIRGRMGRARYLRLTLLAVMLLTFGTIMLIVPWTMSRVHGIELAPLGLSSFLALVMLVPGAWIAVASSIRRMHDMGWSALWLALCVVPVEVVALPAALVLSLAMSFMRGMQGDNIHGPDPTAP